MQDKTKSHEFLKELQKFGSDLTTKFKLPVMFNPEDQLKGPVEELIRSAGQMLNLNTTAVTEAQLEDIAGRPDMAIMVKSLLNGYIELKAPGKGADTRKFKSADKLQWNKFKDLPNIIYTDGNQWALYRSGDRIGHIILLCGDITSDGDLAACAKGDIRREGRGSTYYTAWWAVQGSNL